MELGGEMNAKKSKSDHQQGNFSWWEKLSSPAYRRRFCGWMRTHFADAMIGPRTGLYLMNYWLFAVTIAEIVQMLLGIMLGEFLYVLCRAIFASLFGGVLLLSTTLLDEIKRADSAGTWEMLHHQE